VFAMSGSWRLVDPTPSPPTSVGAMVRLPLTGRANEADTGASDGARVLLEAERQQALQRFAALTGDFNEVVAASRDSNADDEHDPEGATIAFERSQVAALALQVRGHVAEVDAAIQRLDGGTYGICERCGQPIARARLEARPAARTCISCASAAR